MSKKTYAEYVDAMFLFEQYLNDYGHQGLKLKEQEYFEQEFNKGREFNESFETDKINSFHIKGFFADFLIHKVLHGKQIVKSTFRVIRKYLKWAKGKGYLPNENYKELLETTEKLKDEILQTIKFWDLLQDYVYLNQPLKCLKIVHGYFWITKIEPGKLWLEDYIEGKKVGPVVVNKKITSECKLGWVVSLELCKTAKGWRILEVWNVYPL